MANSGMFLFLIFLVFVGTKCDDVEYNLVITDRVLDCENFENKAVNASGLSLRSKKGDDGNNIGKLGGTIETYAELISDYFIEIDIWKQMDMGDEYMYNTKAMFGPSLEKTDAPWSPLMQSLGIEKCPVPPTVFTVDEISVSLDCVKDVLCHDFCGDYRIEMSFVDEIDKISCHTISVCIVEEEIAEKKK